MRTGDCTLRLTRKDCNIKLFILFDYKQVIMEMMEILSDIMKISETLGYNTTFVDSCRTIDVILKETLDELNIFFCKHRQMTGKQLPLHPLIKEMENRQQVWGNVDQFEDLFQTFLVQREKEISGG